MSEWNALPAWLRVATVLVGVPSFIAGFYWEPAFIGAGAIWLLQMVFVARALWRHDI